MTVALNLNFGLMGESIAIGASQAGMYGLMAVALVLTFRVSRTAAFVHGGLVVVGALGYWLLTYPPDSAVPGYRPGWHGLSALITMTAVGMALGALYGTVAMSRRMGRVSRAALTTLSLGTMLLLLGVMTSPLFRVQIDTWPPSPFGASTFRMLDIYVSKHQGFTIVVAIAVVTTVGLVLTRTRSGLDVRAIADDVEASQWSGVRLERVGRVVYSLSGGISALAGALVCPMLGPDPIAIFFVFLRALTVAVMGGFNSLTMALAGSVALGVVDASLRTGFVDGLTMGQREMVVMTFVSLVVLLIARRRPVLELVAEET